MYFGGVLKCTHANVHLGAQHKAYFNIIGMHMHNA